MKKLILLGLVVVVVSVICVAVVFQKSEASFEAEEVITDKTESSEELSTEEVDEEQIVVDTTKPEVASSETKKTEEPKQSTTTKSETSSPKQENSPSSVPKTETKQTETIPPKVEESKTEQDPEYLRLLSQVEYKTYEEAMKEGFAIAEKDTGNIAGFSCPYIVYKGQILGYRLEITYY